MAKIQGVFMFIVTRSGFCPRRVVRARLVFFILSLLSFLHLSITNANASYSLFTSASSVQTGANITVTWTAPPGSSTKDWVSLYKTGDSNQSYIAKKWVFTNGATTGSFTTTAPTTAGTYEFRYLLNAGFTDAKRSSSISVGAAAPQPPPVSSYNLTTSASSVQAGGSIKVTWTAPSGSSTKDWVSLYKTGDSNQSLIGKKWVYTNGATTGSFTTTAPTTAGTYEFRYLLNNGYTDVKRSSPIAVATVLSTPPPPLPLPETYQGFGAGAVEGKNIYHVTNLDDSGVGSLRDCVSEANRKCVFDVAGTIKLTRYISINKPFITVDGLTAPAPGITLTDSIYVKDAALIPHNDTHDVIVRGIRIKKNGDGEQWALACLQGFSNEWGATSRPPYNIVFSQISIGGATDDQLAITQGCNNVTVDRVAFFDARDSHQNALIDGGAVKISMHRSFFGGTSYRNPQVQFHLDRGEFRAPEDVQADIRNNLVFMRHSAGYGISFWRGGKGNVINSVFLHAAPGIARGLNNAIHVCTPNGIINPRATAGAACTQPASGAYVDGNLFFSAYASEPLAIDMDNLDYKVGTPPMWFPAAAVRTTTALAAACEVLQTAGMFPRLPEEQQEINLAAAELAKFGSCHN